MPPNEPSDDFSQLPTADGVAPRGVPSGGAPTVRRQQTRIGPRSKQPEEALEVESQPLSDDWNELLESTDIHESLENEWAEWTTPSEQPEQELTPEPEAPAEHEPEPEQAPPPLQAPRRTVIGMRPPVSEEPAPEEAPSSKPEASRPTPKVPPSAENAPKPASKPKKAAPKKQAHAPSSKEDVPPSEEAKDKAPNNDLESEAKPKEETESTASENGESPKVYASPFRLRWERWGGQALSVSVAIHALLILAGATWVVQQVREPQVDFLPGGGTQQNAAASQALEHQIQQKKSPWLKKSIPMRKIAAVGSISDIVLPDEAPDLLQLPQSNDLLKGNKLTAGMGLGGAGGGFGKSMGLGSQSGMVFQPFSMFGMEIKAKRLAVVLDVSTSMAPHLPRVIEELDRVAKGSVVVLYFGCGLESPPPTGLSGDEIYSTSSTDFEKFWRLGGATLTETKKFRIDTKVAIPSEDIYRLLSKRPQTYFIHNVGLGFTWLALLSDRVRGADGIYWFSDFQDRVDFQQINIVRENLQRRQQRLYMHAYMRGSAYDLVRTQLVEPTKGDVKLEE